MNSLKSMLNQCLTPAHCLNTSTPWRKASKLLMAWAAVLALCFLSSQAPAQTFVTIKPFQVRMEVPAGLSGTYYINPCSMRAPTNVATSYYLDADGTNYWIIPTITVGVSGATAGCTATLVDSGLVNPIGPITFAKTTSLNITNGTATSSNLIVKLVFDGTQASGVSTLSITATGTGINDTFLLPVEVAKIWNGSANAALNGAGSFTDSTKWLGGSAPGPTDNVVFTDVGTQTNSLVGVGSLVSTNYLTNCVITSSSVISSLRFAQTNGLGTPQTNYHNLYINPGVTLAIAGNDGFKMLRDYTYWKQVMIVSIYGTNGTLIQTNENSSFSILAAEGSTRATLDMSKLGSLHLDVNRLYLDDFSGYPNFYNLEITNSYTGTTPGSGGPSAFYGTWSMAGTNYVKATYVDPYNYTNVLSRNYALTLGRNPLSGGGSSTDAELYMGNSNVFNLDSICIAGTACLGADFHFLNTGSYAKFRNADGVSRMSMFATADAGGVSFIPGSKTKCGGSGTGVDFTKGTVDMLVDRLYMSLDATNNYAAGNGYSQTSGFYLGAGTIDANTVILGYQSQGNATNGASCYANCYLTNATLLKVNNTLTLGYTTAAVPEASCYGVLNIAAGSTVMANNIAVGGPAKTSVGNNIVLTSGASLIVSNDIADATPNGALGTLSFGGNSSLTLFINGAKPQVPLVYVTTLSAAGTGNKLIIGGVTNLTYPAYVPLIQGAGATISSPFDAGVTMPAGSGLYGIILPTSSTNTINLEIIARTASHLLWRGTNATGTADWDYTTPNWLDQTTGLMTNYNNPDIVAFDDNPGVATNINLSGGVALSPSAVNMTNNTLYYTFLNGPNQIQGSAALNKYGSGTVEVDGNTTLNVQLNQGALTGFSSGSVGGVSVTAGAVMNYYGAIGGSLNCAGTATSSGSIAGTLTVLPGGVVTNSGTAANPFSVQTNGFLFNTALGSLNNIGAGSSGAPQVASGGVFVNDGAVGANSAGGILYVSGTFKDLGDGSDSLTLQSVTVGACGTFIPGGNGTGTTTITGDGTGTFPGTALLVQGSTNIFKINVAGSANTLLNVASLSFGGSSSQRSQNGCTLLIINTSGTPFSAGQSFKLFTSLGGTGSSTNTYPVITPRTPGAGLVWDLSQLWPGGYIGVAAAGSGPTLTNSFAGDGTGTNIVGQFSWDSSKLGYRLESLVTPLSLGLAATNWTSVSGSWTNTTMTITNVIGPDSVFYRLVFP